MPRDPDAIRAHNRINQANGDARWHAKAHYDDGELFQGISFRPLYDGDEAPYSGDVHIDVISHDKDGGFAEIDVALNALELRAALVTLIACIDADQRNFEHRLHVRQADEAHDVDETDDEGDDEEEEDEGDEEEEEEDEGDEEEEEEEDPEDGGDEEEEEETE